jgi:hypothetical protein
LRYPGYLDEPESFFSKPDSVGNTRINSPNDNFGYNDVNLSG